MRPSLEACYFDGMRAAGRAAIFQGQPERKRHADIYERMAKVLEYSAHKHCKGWDVNVAHLTPPNYVSIMGNQSHVWNTQKLEHWRRRTLDAPNGAELLLIDGDMIVMKPLDDIWRIDFDVAYTLRDGGSRLPLNGGVVFVRVSDATRAFIDRWWEVNVKFLGNSQQHRHWRAKYAGINQASFGYLLEHEVGALKIHKLRCSEWNLCEWERHDPLAARIIHIKSGLRRVLFKLPPLGTGGTNVKNIVRMWNAEELEMRNWQRLQVKTPASTGIEATPSTLAAG